MRERFLGSIRKFVIRNVIDIRSDEEIMNAHNAAEAELEGLVGAFMRGEITPEEMGEGFDSYCKNPDAGIDLRRAASKLGSP